MTYNVVRKASVGMFIGHLLAKVPILPARLPILPDSPLIPNQPFIPFLILIFIFIVLLILLPDGGSKRGMKMKMRMTIAGPEHPSRISYPASRHPAYSSN